MASECGHRLLPIPCCSREYRSTAHLQAARQPALAKRSGSSQPTYKEKVGVTDSSLRQVDTHTPNPAPLSSRPLPRHTSLIRAVCVDAHVRIRPGGHSVMSVPTGTVKNRWNALLGVADEMRVQASAQTSSSAKRTMAFRPGEARRSVRTQSR